MAKRARPSASKPTYAEIEQRLRDAERRNAELEEQRKGQALEAQTLNERLRDAERRCSELEEEVIALKARLAGDAQGAAADETLTVEVQGQKWKELFVSSDVFREHIAPKLGEPSTALLLEACGVARSGPEAKMTIVKMKMPRNCVVSSITMLLWCKERGYSFTTQTTAAAAAEGNLDVLKYLHENGCPWNKETCLKAASGCHLDVLKYARENGCPWNRQRCLESGKGFKHHPKHAQMKAWIQSQPD